MKGIVFVELLKMAEDMLGEEVVDRVIDSADLPSGGAYTGVGNYPCAELMSLVSGFSKVTSVPEAELQRLFGHWMMTSFETHYPGFFKNKTNAFDMLDSIEEEVHVEVRKIYPDAELPSFNTHRVGDKQLKMTYQSSRPLAPFCKGLIEGCMTSFKEDAVIDMRDASIGNTTIAEFTVTRT